jgi:hypothetical protein
MDLFNFGVALFEMMIGKQSDVQSVKQTMSALNTDEKPTMGAAMLDKINIKKHELLISNSGMPDLVSMPLSWAKLPQSSCLF